MRRFIICFLMLTSYIMANAIDITEPIDSFIELNDYMQIYVDSTKNLDSITIMEKLNTGKFVPLNSIDSTEWKGKFDRGRYNYWYYFEISNSVENLNIFFKAMNIDEMLLFENQKYELYPQNDALNNKANEKLLANDQSIFFITCPNKGKFTFLLQQSGLSPNLPGEFYLYNPKYYYSIHSIEMLRYYNFYCFLFGSCFILVLIYFIQYLVSKEKMQIYFSVFLLILFFFGLRALQSYLPIFQFFPQKFVEFKFYLPSTFVLYAAYLVFINVFLDAKHSNRKFHYWIYIFIGFLIIWLAIDYKYLDDLSSWKFGMYFRVLFLSSTLFLTFAYLNLKDTLNRIVCIGTSILIVNMALILVFATINFNYVFFDWIHINELIAYATIYLWVICYSIGLGYKSKRDQEQLNHSIIEAEKQKIEAEKQKIEAEKQIIEAETQKEINESKTLFFNKITHEFRTPLTIIELATNEIEQHQKEKESIIRNTNYLISLIDEILRDPNTLQPKFVQSDILKFIKLIISQFSDIAKGQKKELYQKKNFQELIMDFDPQIIERVLNNLLSNALKFTKEKDKITIDLFSDGKQLIIKIIDTGIGIKAENIAYIFEPYHQEESAQKEFGLGLGLKIVKDLLIQIGGSIKCESEIEQGTTFIVTLPINNTAPVNNKINLKPKNCSNEKLNIQIIKDETLPRIVLVEDNIELMNLLIEILQRDYNIQAAINGEIAYRLIENNPPDIIISDIMMPEMDGLELCKKVKNNPKLKDIPFYFLTARTSQKQVKEGLKLGARGYFKKPFDPEQLLIVLKNCFDERNKTKNPYESIYNDTATNAQFKFLKEVQVVIIENMDNEKFNNDLLAKKLNTNTTTLNTKIFDYYGLTTAEHITKIKMDAAKHLILNTDEAISEIAMKVGFNDQSNFTKKFKQYFGDTPSFFRKRGY